MASITEIDVENHRLLTELPDPQQDLWVQPLLITCFHYFPKLPLELRMIIYGMMDQKSQHIDLCSILSPKFFGDELLKATKQQLFIEIQNTLPATLHLNQESRAEILKSLILVHKDKNFDILSLFPEQLNLRNDISFCKPKPPFVCLEKKPFKFSPGLDTAFLLHDIIWPFDEFRQPLLDYLVSQAPTLFVSIEVLEVRDFGDPIMLHAMQSRWQAVISSVKKPSFWYESLLRFPNLKKLVFVLHEEQNSEPSPTILLPNGGSLAAFKWNSDVEETFLTFMARFMEENWKGMAPKISVKTWSKLKTSTD